MSSVPSFMAKIVGLTGLLCFSAFFALNRIHFRALELPSKKIGVSGSSQHENLSNASPSLQFTWCKDVSYSGGHSHMEVTGMCGQDPQSRGLSVTD